MPTSSNLRSPLTQLQASFSWPTGTALLNSNRWKKYVSMAKGHTLCFNKCCSISIVLKGKASQMHEAPRIVVHCCQLFLIVAHCCPLFLIVAHCFLLLPIVSYCCLLFLIVAHFCPLFPIVVHCCQPPPRSAMIYFTNSNVTPI